MDYLNDVIRDTQAESVSDAIRLIITERMIEDKNRGEIVAFTYAPAPTPRDRRIKRSRTIDTGKLLTFPLGEPPANAGPLPATRTETNRTGSEKPPAYFGEIDRPVFPGTRAQYEEALRLRTINEKQFKPPE